MEEETKGDEDQDRSIRTETLRKRRKENKNSQGMILSWHEKRQQSRVSSTREISR